MKIRLQCHIMFLLIPSHFIDFITTIFSQRTNFITSSNGNWWGLGRFWELVTIKKMHISKFSVFFLWFWWVRGLQKFRKLAWAASHVLTHNVQSREEVDPHGQRSKITLFHKGKRQKTKVWSLSLTALCVYKAVSLKHEANETEQQLGLWV